MYHKEDVTYTYARCMRECEMTNMMRMCDCVDAHMEGNLFTGSFLEHLQTIIGF
jgi:hypothetical protein